MLNSGFNAFGKLVPNNRKQIAYEFCKGFGLDNQQAWVVVHNVALLVEKDKPYEELNSGMNYLDLTGAYRLLAVLCTE